MSWRLDCGSYQLYVIDDGYYWRDPKAYHAEAEEHDWRFHQIREDGKVRLNFGCFVISDGEHLMMVDAGIGEIEQPDMVAGLMPQRFDELGFDRSDVELVVYTHMHYDHIGGSQRNGEIVFPNARHLFHSKEWEFWKAVDNDFSKAARRIMQPLFDAKVVDFTDEETELMPGIAVRESFGHTPGHLSVEIADGGERVLVGGDLSNHPFQVEHPNWSLPVDNDPNLAAETRDLVFEQIVDTETTFVAGHYPMPGVGRIVTDSGRRVFSPVDVSPVVAEAENLDGLWAVDSYLADSERVDPLGEPTVGIDGDTVSGTTGLNRFRGKIEDSKIAGHLALTRMAGPPELMDQENRLVELLTSADEIVVTGEGMEFRSEGLTTVWLTKTGTEPGSQPSK